jgi:hypothetical protein
MSNPLSILSGASAANAQQNAASNASAPIVNAQNQAQGYLQPYNQAGQQALSPLTALITGQSYDPTTGQVTQLTNDQRMSNFLLSPGYQFNLTQGLQAIQKQQAATGTTASGGAMKAITNYAQGNASNEYNNYLNNLFQLAGIGSSAATAQANTANVAGQNLSSLAYAGGMGNVNRYNNLSNAGFGLAGLGLMGAMQNNGARGSSGGNSLGAAPSLFSSLGSLFGGSAPAGFSSVGAGELNTGAFSGAGADFLAPSTGLSLSDVGAGFAATAPEDAALLAA